jgi:hypothetical protein
MCHSAYTFQANDEYFFADPDCLRLLFSYEIMVAHQYMLTSQANSLCTSLWAGMP